MACGAGLHDQYLKVHYYVEGADLSPELLPPAPKGPSGLPIRFAPVLFARGQRPEAPKTGAPHD